MALSRPQAYEGMSLPVSQMRSGPNDGHPVYAMDQQHLAGSYGGHYGMQGAQHGDYQGVSAESGWTERVLDEMKDMLVLLTPQGRINYATPSCKNLTGRGAKQLEGSLLAQYIHEDDQAILQKDLDESVAANQSFRTHLRFQKTNGTYCLMEAYGHPHLASPNERQSGQNTVGFFLICRPYPNKISQLLDSFLEHKIENARLIQQIAKLKQEEDEESTAARAPYSRVDEPSSLQVGSGSSQSAPSGAGSSDHESHSPDTLGANSDESDTNQSAEYYPEPPAESYTHIDGIEVMTGLYYGDGERSQGLSTGGNRGRLVHCDIDITTAADQERNAQEGDRRKRLKSQHVCGDCGTADSPEWRKGPNGPKTLCNACGCKFPVIPAPILWVFHTCRFLALTISFLVRWSKKEKKRQESA
ncbi:unnamed protein product [Penicillium salamii]|nr:unnamed protein product [Penicillium salamii]CAG8288306.1 unnamed protein product [Penicillium salamii]